MNFTKEDLNKMSTFQLKNQHRYINNVLGNAKHVQVNVLFPENHKDKENKWKSVLQTTPEVQEELRQVVMKAYKEQRKMIRKEWAAKEEADRLEFYRNNDNKALVWKDMQISIE